MNLWRFLLQGIGLILGLFIEIFQKRRGIFLRDQIPYIGKSIKEPKNDAMPLRCSIFLVAR